MTGGSVELGLRDSTTRSFILKVSVVGVATSKISNMSVRSLGELLLQLLLLVTVLQNEVVVIGLRMEKVHVPETGLHGGSETLRCDFQLESDLLLSLKWYKDEVNFFSYTPQASPPFLYFPIDGFDVQKNATLNEITLRNLTLNATGYIKCEVSAERPSYRTLEGGGNLTIVVPPDPESPRINNISSTILMGDTISGNCTSFRSRPPAQLTFRINGEKVERPEVIEYRPFSGTWMRSGELVQLYTTNLGLKFQVKDKHFRQGRITLKCTAKVGPLERSTTLIIQHQNYPHHLSGQIRNSGRQLYPLGVISCIIVIHGFWIWI